MLYSIFISQRQTYTYFSCFSRAAGAFQLLDHLPDFMTHESKHEKLLPIPALNVMFLGMPH